MVAFTNRNKIVYVVCKLCNTEYAISLNENDLDRWISGESYIQECLDYLTPSERELLISETCDSCWKSMYGEDE